MTALEALTKVRAFLSVRENWCQRHMTTTGSNKCLVAALTDFVGRNIEHPCYVALAATAPRGLNALLSTEAQREWRLQNLAGVNDTLAHSEMLDWLDRTIASEKAKNGVEALKVHLTATSESIDAPVSVAVAKLELAH